MRIAVQQSILGPVKAFLAHINTITDHVTFYLNDEGVYVQGLDGGNCAMFDATWAKGWFEQYSVTRTPPVNDPALITVEAKQLCSVLACVPPESVGILLELDAQQTRLVISVMVASKSPGGPPRRTQEFRLQLLDVDVELLNVREKECSIDFALPHKRLYDIIAEHRQWDGNTTIKCDEHGIMFITNGGDVQQTTFMGTEETHGFEIEEEYAYKLTFNSRQLSKMLGFHKFSASPNKVESGLSHISLDDDHPFMVRFDAPGTTAAYVRIYVAPMVETDVTSAKDEEGEMGAEILVDALSDAAMMSDE